jgi:hypothetical protein
MVPGGPGGRTLAGGLPRRAHVRAPVRRERRLPGRLPIAPLRLEQLLLRGYERVLRSACRAVPRIAQAAAPRDPREWSWLGRVHVRRKEVSRVRTGRPDAPADGMDHMPPRWPRRVRRTQTCSVQQVVHFARHGVQTMQASTDGPAPALHLLQRLQVRILPGLPVAQSERRTSTGAVRRPRSGRSTVTTTKRSEVRLERIA